MGNCQAIDAASLVIQHPNGRVERLYWPITANEVMKANPSHYVALIITSSVGNEEKNVVNGNGGVRVTRVKLLKATDMLNLGHAYRLIDSKEVMKGLWAKKYAKMKMKEHESTENTQTESQKPEARTKSSEVETSNNQIPTQEKQRQRGTPSSSASGRGRQWRPSLQSISEAGLSQQGQKTVQQLGRHYERGDVFRTSSSSSSS